MWRWRWNGEWCDVNGCERWDMVGDLDSVWSVDSVESDGVKALRMGRSGGKTVLAAIGRNGQGLRLARNGG